MTDITCPACTINSAGEHEWNCPNREERSGYVQIGDMQPIMPHRTLFNCPECNFICDVVWRFCPGCGQELGRAWIAVSDARMDFQETDSLKEAERVIWKELAKELAAVLVTVTCNDWMEERKDLLDLPLSPTRPEEILTKFKEQLQWEWSGREAEGSDE